MVARRLPLLLLTMLLAWAGGCARRGERGQGSEPPPPVLYGPPTGPAFPPAAAAPSIGPGSAAPGAASLRSTAGGRVVIPIRAFLVSNDDGSRPARTRPEQMAAWVDFANRSFAPAGIELRYDGALLPLTSTIVNEATTASDMQRVDAILRPWMAQYAGELLVLTRYGPRRSPSREAFSGLILDYVVMSGFESMRHCGHPHLDAFAHELGHFFGLAHTFTKPARSVEEAEATLRAAGGRQAAFDGDGLADTPPDPALTTTECTRDGLAVVGGQRFSLPRRNLMSYYDERDSLSPQQIELVQWVLGERLVRGMRAPKNDPAFPIEAERMPREGEHHCAVQDMKGYRDGHWSGNTQIMCAGPVALTFSVRRRGPQRLILYATRAPDYAPVEVRVDGQVVGAYEGRAPLVMPTGPIPLGVLRLSDGEHTLEVGPSARAGARPGGAIGVDALQLVDAP